MGPAGESPDPAFVEEWLAALGMHNKLDFDSDRITNINLSQHKRLAMLLASASYCPSLGPWARRWW
ncbi:hypothetical protein [Vreelandella glaciei]|uniref:hypothetical protein n=1 Tax=Vreelandella glaciei TaxID=186761 RepID=UPI003001FBCA